MREDERWLPPEEQDCRLLLLLPSNPLDDPCTAAIERAARCPRVAGLILPSTGREPAVLARWRETAHEARCVLLLLDDVEAARAVHADGVHLSDWCEVPLARESLGDESLIGAECGTSRHAAMVAGERGADYVVFGIADDAARTRLAELCRLCAWWSELFVLPCAVHVEPDEESVSAVARNGAAFALIGAAIWRTPEEATARIERLASSLATPVIRGREPS